MNPKTEHRNNLGLAPSIKLVAIADAMLEEGLALKYVRRPCSQAAASLVLMEHYVAHGFTPDEAEWCADRDRENKTREWELATTGELI